MIVDAHNDLLLELVLAADDSNPFAVRWLPKLRRGGVALQICPIYVGDAAGTFAATARRQISAFERAVRENDGVVAVGRGSDLDGLGRDRIGLMLALEGAEALEGRIDALDAFVADGVRLVGLTHNPSNEFAGGVDSTDGLTRRGRALVAELAARQVIIDLAHASERTYFEVLELTSTPVVVSHACCRAVHEHRRNLTDEQLRSLAERGGVLGLMALQFVVGPGGTVERFIDHLDHAVAVIGIDHVGIGADFIDQVIEAEAAAGLPMAPVVEEAVREGGGRLGLADLRGPEHFPALVAALERRGYTGPDLEQILQGNFLRVLRAGLPA